MTADPYEVLAAKFLRQALQPGEHVQDLLARFLRDRFDPWRDELEFSEKIFARATGSGPAHADRIRRALARGLRP